jgi:hypothetical protein
MVRLDVLGSIYVWMKSMLPKQVALAEDHGSIFSCRLATISGILCVVSGVVPVLFLQVAASVPAFQ